MAKLDLISEQISGLGNKMGQFLVQDGQGKLKKVVTYLGSSFPFDPSLKMWFDHYSDHFWKWLMETGGYAPDRADGVTCPTV